MFQNTKLGLLKTVLRAMSPVSNQVVTPVTVHCQVASMKRYIPIKNFDDVKVPEKPRLTQMPKVPNIDKPRKEFKNLRDIWFPETVETELEMGQYGIKALRGGYMKYGHFEMVRRTLGKRLDIKKAFAKWRIDPPYKAVTKKGQGQRMGGGKGNINHYVTPVRPDRIVFEVWGKIEFQEVQKALEEVRGKLPFPAKVVSVEILEEDRRKEKLEEEQNENPWTFERIVKGNYMGVNKILSPYDHIYFGKYYG